MAGELFELCGERVLHGSLASHPDEWLSYSHADGDQGIARLSLYYKLGWVWARWGWGASDFLRKNVHPAWRLCLGTGEALLSDEKPSKDERRDNPRIAAPCVARLRAQNSEVQALRADG